MKRRISVCLFAVCLALLGLPLVNLLLAPNRDAVKWRERSFLYNMDIPSGWLARVLYPVGVSTDPKRVIVGRDGWLYLGDDFGKTVSVDRSPRTSSDLELGKQIGAAADAWSHYLSKKGVKLYRVMIGPNKGTIYPEHMPGWARPVSPNATDALFAGAGELLYIDLRTSLLAAKAHQPADLYYKTDTHWNGLGAGLAFRAFAQQVSAAAPDLRWPSDPAYELSRVVPRAGGDLARFLRLSASLDDFEAVSRALELPVETTQVDFDTSQVMHEGGNPAVPSPFKPLLVRSEGALNKKRVLWLRDSFGTGMSPLMAATFTDVLQLHWTEAIKPGGRLLPLVDAWKPDYVFLTVVERDSRAESFAAFPPPEVLTAGGHLKPIRTTTPVARNDLVHGDSANEHRIDGSDPFIDFVLSDAMTPAEARYLSIDLTCDDGTTLVPLQLFWLEAGNAYFDELHSAHFSVPTGRNLLDLHTLGKWKSARSITRLRLDIDSRKACTRFRLSNPSVGERVE